MEKKKVLVRLLTQHHYVAVRATNYKELVEKAKENLKLENDSVCKLIILSTSQSINNDEDFEELENEENLVLLKNDEDLTISPDTQKSKRRKLLKPEKYFEQPTFHIIPNEVPLELSKHREQYRRFLNLLEEKKKQDATDTIAKEVNELKIAFASNFMDALQVQLPPTSRFYTDPILWTSREKQCAQQLIRRIMLAEQNHRHISSIFVGMKGTGKTTLIQNICIVAGALSDTLFVTYFDITSDEDLNPINMLNEGLRLEGDSTQFDTMSELLDYIREKKQRKLFTVIDEAQKYYKDKREPIHKQQTSLRIIRQVYELGIASGSTCVLCGSSSKLADLALQRKITDTAKELQIQYPGYDSLNDQKFTPVVLPLIERQDLPAYLKFLGLPFDEKAATEQWMRTGGSLRYLVNNGNYPSVGIPLQGATSVILLWMYSQQPKTSEDTHKSVDTLKTVPLTTFDYQKKHWSDNGILSIDPLLIFNLIDECVISATYGEDGSPTAIGFAHPSQYLQVLQYDNEPHDLTAEQRIWLQNPKPNGDKLEWLVEQCVQKKPITKKLVLCFGDINSDCEGVHEDVFLPHWDPLGRHLDQVMKVYPDNYGVDMIKVSLNDGVVQLYTAQMKLGASNFGFSKTKKRDSVTHMLQRFKNVSTIEDAIKTRIGKRKLIVTHNAYITRKLPVDAKTMIQGNKIVLFDREDMIKKVWSQAVLDYAQSVPIQWITEASTG